MNCFRRFSYIWTNNRLYILKFIIWFPLWSINRSGMCQRGGGVRPPSPRFWQIFLPISDPTVIVEPSLDYQMWMWLSNVTNQRGEIWLTWVSSFQACFLKSQSANRRWKLWTPRWNTGYLIHNLAFVWDLKEQCRACIKSPKLKEKVLDLIGKSMWKMWYSSILELLPRFIFGSQTLHFYFVNRPQLHLYPLFDPYGRYCTL